MFRLFLAMLIKNGGATTAETPKATPLDFCQQFDQGSIKNRTCPDPDIRFYLYTRSNPDERQLIYIDDTWDASNLSSSFFDPLQPTKIIIHGFRSDMFLTPLFQMKTGECYGIWLFFYEFST